MDDGEGDSRNDREGWADGDAGSESDADGDADGDADIELGCNEDVGEAENGGTDVDGDGRSCDGVDDRVEEGDADIGSGFDGVPDDVTEASGDSTDGEVGDGVAGATTASGEGSRPACKTDTGAVARRSEELAQER